MEIKLLKGTHRIKGTIHKARILKNGFIDISPSFQIIEGEFMGEVIPYQNCIVLPDEITYTEKEWNDMENYYMSKLDKESEQKERAQQLVNNLTESLKKKNAEIETLDYCVNVLAGSLHAMTEAFHKFKGIEKFHKS